MEKTRFIDFDDASRTSPPSDAARVERLREFCQTWERAVKTICLYPPTNPLPEEFRQKFFDALERLLEDEGAVTIAAGDAAFSVDGDEVYRRDTNDENLAYLFFRDGICRISYEEGVSKDESDRFLGAIADVFSSPNANVDLANRLWQEALPHIRHFTMDRIIEGAYIDVADDEVLASRHLQFLNGTSPPETEEPAATRSPYLGLQSERFEQILNAFGDVTNLSESEQAELAIQIRPDSDETAEQIGLEILFEVLRTADHPRLVEQTISVTEQQLNGSVTGSRWGMVRYILENWNLVASQSSAGVARQVQSARLRAVDNRYFESLSAYLNDNPQCDLHEVRGVLGGLGTAALTLITSMLGVLEHKAARMMVCDHLAEHGKDAIDLIGGFVYDKRWFVVRNVAKVLGEIGSDRALSFLKKSAQHSDSRVRLETLKALQQITSPGSVELMLGLLNDEDDAIYRRALRALGDTGSAQAAGAIRKEIDTLSPTAIDPDHLREMYTAYSRTGGQDAVDFLRKQARRTPLFGRRRWQDVRLAAILALSASPELTARAELSSLAMSRTRVLAKAARDAEAQWMNRQSPQAGGTVPTTEETVHAGS